MLESLSSGDDVRLQLQQVSARLAAPEPSCDAPPPPDGQPSSGVESGLIGARIVCGGSKAERPRTQRERAGINASGETTSEDFDRWVCARHGFPQHNMCSIET